MPRARKKKSVIAEPVTEPTPLAAVLEPTAERLHLPEPITQPQLPAPAERELTDGDAMSILEASRLRKGEIEPERAMPEPNAHLDDTNVADNGQAAVIAGKHTAAVLSGRPQFGPVPAGFFPVASDRQAGIRVSKKTFRDRDGFEKSIAAIQFAENRLPTREEKDILERVGHAPDGQNYTFKTERRQWERVQPEGWPMGENTIDTVRVMEGLSAVRNEGRGR